MTAVISYDRGLTLRRNFNRLKEEMGVNTAYFSDKLNTSSATLNNYVSNFFLSATGKETVQSINARALLDTYFIGGLPAEFHEKNRKKENLFRLFGCERCQHRMRSQDGCFKFSFTKTDINSGHFIVLLGGSGFHLSKKQPCPYAA